MVVESLADHTVDRIVDLNGIPLDTIHEHGYHYLLEDDYLVPEAIFLHTHEVSDLKRASSIIYGLFEKAMDQIIKKNDWSRFDIPELMQELIAYTWKNRHVHLLGRFDFAGGVDSPAIKLLEFNADTPTMVPESSIIQDEFIKHYSRPARQFNYLQEDLTKKLDDLGNEMQESHHSMLFTSLGYEEDVANLKPIMQAAEAAGFTVAYSDLEFIEFAENEGIFLTDDMGISQQFDYLYKLVPWEFICYEEPGLLRLLHNLVLNDINYIINPAYTMLMQSKAFLTYVYEMNPGHDLLLESSMSPNVFKGKAYVEKVTFGRLGENIKIVNQAGSTIAKTEGDFGDFPKMYQEYTDLYKDDDGDVYQAGLYVVNGMASCLSFRRCDKLIIDDDAEFIPHLIL
jgi:glutathionylspermidine synthase